MNDKFTDKLFQEGANRYDFEYNEAAWDQMEGLLDRDLQRRRWLRIGGIIALLMVGIVVALWWGFSDPSDSTLPELHRESSSELPIVESPLSSEIKEEQNNTPRASADHEAYTSTGPETDPQVSERATVSVSNQNQISKTNAIDENVVSSASALKVATNQQGIIRTDQLAPGIATNSTGANTDPHEVVIAPTASTATNSTRKAAYDPLNALHAVVFVPESNNSLEISTLNIVEELTPNAPVAAEEFTSTNSNGLVLGLAVSRVHGGGGDENFSQGQTRYGIDLGYRFGNKLGLQTGAYYGKLSYCAEGVDYTAPDGFWTDGVIARRVEAVCEVIEIPLLLTYHPGGNTNNGFYFSGGVTSYFLLKEDFNFLYDDPTHTGISAWQEVNTNRHLFGMGQLSVGFEQKVGKKSSLQLEAYGQLPLTGIGQGQINLMNIGVSGKLLFDFRKQK